MKKTSLAFAILGVLSSQVFAESNVTLYGLIDEAVMFTKPSGKSANVSLASNFTAGSRWGIRGVEDLGDGTKIGFILEQGFNPDTGSSVSSRAFHRESALYVDGNFGRVTVGRLGTLAFGQSTYILRGAVFGTTYGSSGWHVTGQNLNFMRVDNAIAYRTPEIGGFSLHLMYSNKMNGAEIDDSDSQWSLNNHYYGVGGLYSGGDFQASIMFEAYDNKEGNYASGAKQHLTIGGQWKFGYVTPQAIYQYQWGDVYKQHAAAVGVGVDLAGGTFRGSIKYVTRTNAKDGGRFVSDGYSSGNTWNVGFAYSYPFSKHTSVYAYAGWSDSGKGWSKNSWKNDHNFNGYALAAGMKHTF